MPNPDFCNECHGTGGTRETWHWTRGTGTTFSPCYACATPQPVGSGTLMDRAWDALSQAERDRFQHAMED